MVIDSVRLTLVALLSCLVVTAVGEEPERSQVELFAQLDSMKGPHLSPDGTQIAFLSAIGGRFHVVIERFSPTFSRYMVLPGDGLDFDWVRWANNGRLVISASWSSKRDFDVHSVRAFGVKTEETRLFSVDSLGQDLTYIIKPDTFKVIGSRVPVDRAPPVLQDDVISWLPDDPDHILVALDANFDGMTEVRRVNVNNGDYKTVVGNFSGPVWVADQAGIARMGWGLYVDSDLEGKELEIRAKYLNTKGDWTDVSDTHWAKAEYRPIAFTEDPEVMLAYGPNETGLTVIRKLNLETGEFLETVFEHEWADVEQVLIDDTSGDAVGVIYTEDLPTVEYFDAGVKRLQKNINAALPDTANRIVSTSKNRRQVLIYASSDTNLGSYYLWDRDAKSLDFYADRIGHLNEGSLSPTKAVQYEARDGLQIPAYLTVPQGVEARNLPTVVLPHGGPTSRSDKGYWFISQFLASQGYAVLQPNFRGSSGYGKAFQDAGIREWGGKMQDDVSDGAQWLIDEGIAASDRMCIVGWSYGGYAAAMGAVKTPDLFQCAASINGVLNLPRQMVHNENYGGARYWNDLIGLEDASARTVSPYHQAEHIKVPMLVVQAKDDARVPDVQARDMVKRLESLDKDVVYVEIEFGGHSLQNVAGRERILHALQKFLAEHIG